MFRSIIMLFCLVLLSGNLYIESVYALDNSDFDLSKSDVGDTFDKSKLGEDTKNILDTSKATNPQCTTSDIVFGAVIYTGIALVVTGVGQIATGHPIIGGVFTTIGTTELILSITEGMVMFACHMSFVRDPVLNYEYDGTDDLGNPVKAGDYKKCKDPDPDTGYCLSGKYIKTDTYNRDQNPAPYSNYLTLCHRYTDLHVRGTSCSSSVEKKYLDPREIEIGDSKCYKKNCGTQGSEYDDAISCKIMKEGDSVKWEGVQYRVRKKADQLCAYVYGIGSAPWWPQQQIGCILRTPGPGAPLCAASTPITDVSGKTTGYDNSGCFSCFVDTSCYGTAGLRSLSSFSATSLVVQCIKSSLDKALHGCVDASGMSHDGFLGVAREHLKSAIEATLLLTIMFLGVKGALGAIQGASEILILSTKIGAVVWFAIGNGMDIYYDQLIKVGAGLNDLVLKAGGNQSICDYKPSEYYVYVPKKNAVLNDNEKIVLNFINQTHFSVSDIQDSGKIQQNIDKAYADNGYNDKLSPFYSELSGDKDKITSALTSINSSTLDKLEQADFSYLAPWDRLDCRIIFYLGQAVNSVGAALAPMVLTLPFGLIMGNFEIVACIFLLIYLFFLILTIVWVVHLYIISLIAVTILIVFAPLFVPMILFQATKGFFDGWLREVIACLIYSVPLMAFLGLMMMMIDNLMFSNGDITLQFKRVAHNTLSSSDRVYYTYQLKDSKQCSDYVTNKLDENGKILSSNVSSSAKVESGGTYTGKKCSKSSDGKSEKCTYAADIMACQLTEVKWKKKNLFLGIYVSAADAAGSLWKNAGMMALICFLNYHFCESLLGSMAAELAGSPRSDFSRHAMSVGRMANKVGGAASAGAGKIKQLGKKVMGGDKKGGDDKKDRAGAGGDEGVSGGSEGGGGE